MSGLEFVIVGVQKGGTSALSAFLDAHPDVCMARGKEAHVFDDPAFSDAWLAEEVDRRYAALFAHAVAGQSCGEATPIYCYWPQIAPRLHRYRPQLKLIMILRDPVDRAVSHYQMTRSRGQERLPLWLALLLEPTRLRRKDASRSAAWRVHSYCDRGHYAEQISNLRRYFPDEQLLVIDNAELMSAHAATLSKVFAFLGLRDVPLPPARQIFSGEYDRQGNRFVRSLLCGHFRASNRRLRDLLREMGYRPDWPWLGR